MAKEYGSESIKSQSELEALRMYPNVYLGSNDLAGATQTIYEILANSVDEANSGFGDKISLTIHKDNSVTIQDHGRGVPMDMNKKEGRYAYELVFCTLHAGGKLKGSRNNYNSSAGQHGIGATATNFSAEWFKVESRRDGYIFKVSFKEGILDGKFEKVKDTKSPQKTGTIISWKPDEKVFTDINFDIEELQYWVKSQAICSDNVEFVLEDKRGEGLKESYKYENGILSYAKELLGENDKLADINLFEASGSGKDQANRPNYTVNAKVAFAFTQNTNHYSFYHNSIPLPTGGAPKRAMQRAFTEYFKSELKKSNQAASKEIEFDDVAESLICIISTTTQEPPSFENQTKKSISNKFIEDFLTLQITKHLQEWAKNNPLELDKVTNQISINIQSRKSASAQKLATKQKLSGKIKLDDRIKNFVDCRNKDAEDRELFIAEGLSAMGSLKQARNGESQALLAIRGKILNTLKVDYNTIFKNELIMDIMKLVGTGVEMSGNKKNDKLGNFDINNRRFDKIIIATDQDVDGLHIIALCLTLFYKLTPELLKQGYVYFLDTPLYEIQITDGKDKGKMLYAFTDEEMAEMTKGKKCKVSRNKGLGEVNSDVMSIFMAPETRRLTQATMEDGKEAEKIFELFMGSDSTDRKEFITLHGKEYTDLDLD